VHLHARFGGDVSLVAFALGTWVAGGLLGLAVLDRVLSRLRPLRVLATTSVIALVAFVLVLVTDHVVLTAIALLVLGGAVATFHPIVSARTYAALPGHPGVVNAVGALFVPLDAAVPLVLGALAGALGPSTPIVALAVVPVAMLLITIRARREGDRAATER
jgi:fucose permease